MNRNISLDILKLILAIMVVIGHGRFLQDITSLGHFLTYNGLFRIIVPCFFIINGYFFYHYLQKPQVKVWFKRLFILYGFWMLFYSYFWFRHRPPVDSASEDLIRLVTTVFFGYYQLWYIPGIIGGAAVLIMFKKLALTSKQLFAVAIGLFLIGVSVQYISNYHLVTDPNIDAILNNKLLYRNFFFMGFPLFAIGYLMCEAQIPKRLGVPFIRSMGVIGLMLLMGESYFNSLRLPGKEGFDFLFSIILACPFIVMTFMTFNLQGKTKLISLYASGIYFIHPAILILLGWYTDLGYLLTSLITLALSIIASVFLIAVNKRFQYIL